MKEKEPKKIQGKTFIPSPSLEGAPLDPDAFVPKTAFGKKLLTLSQKAIADGMTLMTNDEILAEIESRRYGRKMGGT